MAQIFLIGCGAAVCWVVRLYFWPFGPCRRCQGSRTNAGSNRKRWGNCGRCGGTGQRQRLGSKTVHRVVRDTISYQRKKDR
jgi:hypothetical protein